MILFFILTLPVVIFYGSQKYQQITEGRSRASGTAKVCLNNAYTCSELGGTIATGCTNCVSPKCAVKDLLLQQTRQYELQHQRPTHVMDAAL